MRKKFQNGTYFTCKTSFARSLNGSPPYATNKKLHPQDRVSVSRVQNYNECSGYVVLHGDYKVFYSIGSCIVSPSNFYKVCPDMAHLNGNLALDEYGINLR